MVAAGRVVMELRTSADTIRIYKNENLINRCTNLRDGFEALTVHWRRDRNRAGGPGIDVAEGERERLQAVRRELVFVVQNVVVSGA